MRKTDNDELLQSVAAPSHAVQLDLALGTPAPKPLSELQKKQRANFEALCENFRRESALFLSVVQSHYPAEGYTQLKDVSTAHLLFCRAEFEAHPLRPGPVQVPFPEIWNTTRYLEFGPPRPRRQREPGYRPWSLGRRQATGAKNLLDRYRKRFSIGELWVDQAQAQIMRDPWRFGVCPLPAEGSAPIPDPDRILSRQRAIARELELRIQETERQPLVIITNEKVTVEVGHEENRFDI